MIPAAEICPETGLDYFGARYFSGAQGRFTTPDPLMASATVYDPQSWNRYTYGRNNPLRFIDPTGMMEISADECAKDPQCINVKVNVIYDRNANGGEGLTDKQKAKFQNSLLKQAKSEYGDSKIHLDVGYTAGAVKGGKVQGVVRGSLNVIVSDGALTLAPGVTTESGGYALTGININRADSGTLAHEFSHLFAGDTNGLMNSIARNDTSGIIGFGANAVSDIMNDYERFRIGVVGPYFGNRFDPPPGQPLPLNAPFNEGARRFQAPMTQEAIRPRQ